MHNHKNLDERDDAHIYILLEFLVFFNSATKAIIFIKACWQDEDICNVIT